jgi:hemerythrin
MALIEWNDSLKLGVAVVDQQHERLIGILNRLHEATAEGRAAQIISEIIDELIIYTATHFSMEEKYFAQFEYEDAEEHQEEHAALIARVNAFANEYENSAPGSRAGLARQLLEFLGIWWRYHMLETDAKFVALFHEKGLN